MDLYNTHCYLALSAPHFPYHSYKLSVNIPAVVVLGPRPYMASSQHVLCSNIRNLPETIWSCLLFRWKEAVPQGVPGRHDDLFVQRWASVPPAISDTDHAARSGLPLHQVEMWVWAQSIISVIVSPCAWHVLRECCIVSRQSCDAGTENDWKQTRHRGFLGLSVPALHRQVSLSDCQYLHYTVRLVSQTIDTCAIQLGKSLRLSIPVLYS